MKIAFVTTQSLEGSTVVGRVMPIAQELSDIHDIHILIHESSKDLPVAKLVPLHNIGLDPFTKTPTGKMRKEGIPLIVQMLTNSFKSTYKLFKLKPETVIIVKPLPQNVLAVKLWSLFNTKATIILDVDDFELTANRLTSNIQRAAIHWAERTGSHLSKYIVAASPFLKDHFEQLTSNKKEVQMIQTGLSYDYSKINNEIKNGISSNLLYIGSISVHSGHKVDLLPDILFSLKKKFPNIILNMVGSGDDIESLKKSFKDKGLESSVNWHGRFNVDTIDQFLDNKTIIIDPIDSSINNRAKSSFRVSLASAVGLPVITSNIGIRPYLLPEKLHVKLFATPDNADDYATKITDLLRTPLSADESAAMKIHAKQNTWHTLGNKYKQLIN